MYSIADYGAMIADRVRTDAFARALREAITPDAVVIDIGTGTGIFAVLACRFGARRVYAVEPDEAIQVGREIAAANGYADRIEFIRQLSTEVTLPERADLIVSDLGGVLPWFRQHIPSIADARRRLLKPDGVLIPQCDAAWAAVVHLPDVYAQLTDPWKASGYDLDMEAARRLVVNALRPCVLTAGSLLTDTRRWATIEYAAVNDPDVRGRVTWTMVREGTAHGIAAGFERTVAPGILLSSAPDAPDTIRPHAYGTVLFPWPAAVRLETGDVVCVDLHARLVRQHYVWRWKTRVQERRTGADKVRFDQSTFLGAPVSPAALRRSSASYTPALSEDGRILRLVVNAMHDGTPLGEIANLLSHEFPSRFPRPEDALDHVADISRQYG